MTSRPDRTRAERALAYLAALIRPDWDEPGILHQIRRCSEKPFPQVAAAVLHCAHHRRDQVTPACISLDGEHWNALDRMAGRAGTGTGVPERCPRHGQHRPCLRCQAEAAGPPAKAERIASLLGPARERIREAQQQQAAHLEARHTQGVQL